MFKGIRGPGQMGNKRVTQRGLEVVDVRADENLLLVRGSVPGPRGAVVEIRDDADTRPQAPYIGDKKGKLALDEAIFGEPSTAWCTRRCVPSWPPPARHGVDEDAREVAMTGAKAWRQRAPAAPARARCRCRIAAA